MSSAGCLVVSLQPIFDERTIEFHEAWLGTYRATDEDATLTLAKGAWQAYELTYNEAKDTTRLSAHLTRLGSRFILDVTTASGIEEPMVTVQAHLLFRAELEGDRLTLRTLDYDRFYGHLTDKAVAGAVPVLDGKRNVVCTAPTAQLRAWLTAHMGDADLWDEPTTFVREKR